MPVETKTVFGFASERDAVQAGAILSETPGFEAVAMVVSDTGGQWLLECYDDGALAVEAFAGELDAAGLAASSPQTLAIPGLDWVAETQRLLPPVRAGRFVVHGSHDRGRAFFRWAIEIDAGRAFGTAHHGTTRGCLLAIGALGAGSNPRAALDLGTGSGVLAIALAKSFPRARIFAGDIDPIAIAVARGNCAQNGARASVTLCVGDGLKPSAAYARAPFDIAIANILAKPLIKLAPRLRTLTKRGGVLILSGLLEAQAREVLARYRATGFCLIQRRNLEGWATLTLRRAS